MKTKQNEEISAKPFDYKSLLTLILFLTMICISIFVIRSCSTRESEFVDEIANQIEQEMSDSQIVLSSKGGRRTVADFKEPIILTHGKESKLIVHIAELSETISISDKGLGGWDWTSTYQEIEYKGEAQYTIDLSQLSGEDFVVNNELKTLTVRIPYAVLSLINIPDDQIKFHDAQKGWAGPKEIKLTPEQNSQLRIQVNDKMKAKLIDENIIDAANKSAKIVVADLLTTTVQAVDPEFTVVVVQ